MLVFAGELFDTDNEHKRLRNVLTGNDHQFSLLHNSHLHTLHTIFLFYDVDLDSWIHMLMCLNMYMKDFKDARGLHLSRCAVTCFRQISSVVPE